MLFQATLLVDLAAMAVCLWMAFYLFARGFPGRITLRGSILLISLSAFFFGAYNNLFVQIPGTAAWRSTFLIIGFCAWYQITLHLLPVLARRRSQPLTIGYYILALVTVISLHTSDNSFVGEVGNNLYVARLGIGIPYILFGIFEITIVAGIYYNLLAYDRVGLTPAGRYFLIASIFIVCGIIYGLIGLAISPPLPRIFQDLFVFSSIFAVGLSVARHQTLVERRTTLQDFPLATLTVFVIVAAYAFIALRLGLDPQLLGILTAFVVLTHATYDSVREFIDRLRMQNESQFRKQMRKLESKSSDNTLHQRLQEGLDLMCHTLDTSGGFIAVRDGENFIVTASRQSVEKESRVSASVVTFDDVSKTQIEQFPGITHFFPSFDGQTQIAVLGVGKPNNKLEYSNGDIDLLSEVADQVGTIVSLSKIKPRIDQFISQAETNEKESSLAAGMMMDVMEVSPDPEFIKLVEEALRNFSDFITLGQLPLADSLSVKGSSHIERGRELQKILKDSIELLRPEEKRPPEPLPRVWYNHAVLHDAYVEGVPNREIMARLYISEGTFNRTRRNAVRGLARLLMEKNAG